MQCQFYIVDNRDKLPILEEQADATPIGQVTVPATRPELPEHFYRTNTRGLIECVDLHTGRVLCVQASAYDLLEKKFERLVCIQTPQGPVYLEKGLSLDLVPRLQEIAYSKLIADLICEKLADGLTLTKAAKEVLGDNGYSTVRYWRREVPDFANALAEAAKDRAEVFHDEVIETARTKVSGKEKISALQWAAEKGDQTKFGTKKPTSEGSQGNVTFIINTGIRRPGDPGYQETLEAAARPVNPEPSVTQGEAKEAVEEIAVFDVK